jgi:hypothetical protein
MPTAPAKPAKRSSTPAPPPAPGLNRLSATVKVTVQALAQKTGEIPIVRFQGETMKQYNEAVAAEKEAQSIIKELKPVIHQAAMQHIFSHNCSPSCLQAMTSVKLQDVKIDEAKDEDDLERFILGEVTRVSFTSAYNNCNAEQVENTFQQMKGRNVNDYVAETLQATFDDKVFLDADGNFNQKIYDKFRVAVEKVARELDLKNADGSVNSPLKTKRVLIVKSDFHEKRFKDFDVEENFTLTKVLPNTIQCVPVRTV